MMPQETDGSSLVSILWIVWVYWTIYRWLDQQSLLRGGDGHPRSMFGIPVGVGGRAAARSPSAADSLDPFVVELLRRDQTATLEEFLNARLATYEQVVASFDAGDLDSLGDLVSPDVLAVFARTIAEREGPHNATLFAKMESPTITNAMLEEARTEVSIRFAGEAFRIRTQTGHPPSTGSYETCRIVETWTFARTKSDATWRVVATTPSEI